MAQIDTDGGMILDGPDGIAQKHLWSGAWNLGSAWSRFVFERTSVLTYVLTMVVVATLVGCSPHSGGAGHLLICGGGMRDENVAVYSRFMELAGDGATIGIVPAATGVENPGAATLELMRHFARPSQTVVLLPLTKDDTANADMPGVAAQVRACRGLWFVGGDQSRITNLFRPAAAATGSDPVEPRSAPRRDTLIYAATLDVLRAGGVIAGTSAGAAMMSDPMITGGSSEDALMHGATWTNDVKEGQGVGLARGMGYFPYGLIDQHFLERGRLGRLLVAMNAAGIREAWAIRENGCLEVDLASGKMRAIGPYAVTHVSLGRNDPPDASLISNIQLMRADDWTKPQLGD